MALRITLALMPIRVTQNSHKYEREELRVVIVIHTYQAIFLAPLGQDLNLLLFYEEIGGQFR